MTFSLLFMLAPVEYPGPPRDVAALATSWSCEFNDTSGKSFTLKGFFAETSAGIDANKSLPTLVKGEGPVELLGKQTFNVLDSTPHHRSYEVYSERSDRSNYTLLMNLFDDQSMSLATISHYTPKRGKDGILSAVATGHCSATFHSLGYKVVE